MYIDLFTKGDLIEDRYRWLGLIIFEGGAYILASATCAKTEQALPASFAILLRCHREVKQ